VRCHLKVKRDLVRQQSINSQILPRMLILVHAIAHALDSFASDIPDFQGDDSIPAITISARAPNGEFADDSSALPSVGSYRAQAGKRKATATPPPQKKAKKAAGKATGRIKINEPAPKPSSTPTPPKGPQKKFSIIQSNRYVQLNPCFILELHSKLIVCAGPPRILTRSLLPRTPSWMASLQ
jgi:hypothetical protein